MDGELHKSVGIGGICLRFEVFTAVTLKLTEDFRLLGYKTSKPTRRRITFRP
jgi:hypothetical protein